jgi:tRNA A-37 threonylcarbamoyl transferase component Bud32
MTSSSLRDRFAFHGDALDGGDARVLRGAIYEVEEIASGVERTLKLWRKTGTGLDRDLRELWLHEMRQLQRVMAYSGARRLIVDVLELVEDDDHFGVVLERVGQPLETRRRSATRQHWLKNLTAPRSRALFWRNIRRLGEALGIVHGQGLVHGSISTMTVMTEGADEPDFLLGGFEWSLRVSMDGIAGPRLGAAAEAQRAERYSFAEDWRALGMLIAECLGLVVLPSGDVLTREGNDAMSLTVTERLLVRRLVMPARLEALEAQSIVRAIDDIVSTIAKSVSLRTGAFILMFAEQSGVGGVAHTNMGGAFDVDDWPRVLEWVRADLRAGARLLVPRRPAAAQARMHLVTGNAVYALHPFRDEGGSAWDIAVCDHVRPRGERLDVYDYDDHGLDQPIVAVRGTRSAREERGTRGADVLDWGAFVRDEPAPHTNAVDRVRKALLRVQCVEAVIKSLEILPVRIANREETDAGTTLLLRAAPASQNVRDELAKKVGVADTADTLRRLFEDDDRESDRRWRLGQATSLGSSASRDAVMTFIDVAQHGTGYLFETDGDVPDARRSTGEVIIGHKNSSVRSTRRRLVALVVEATRRENIAVVGHETTLAMQVKLLRAVQEHTVRPVGATKDIEVDTRLVAATNRDLAAMVDAGTFRADLFYRLRVVPLEIPPLRERLEGILPLARQFIARVCTQNQCGPCSLRPKTLDLLVAYSWPGNVRELENAIERAVLLAEGQPTIEPTDLPPEVRGITPKRTTKMATPSEVLTLEEVERRHILATLERLGGNRKETAAALGIGENTLWRKLTR